MSIRFSTWLKTAEKRALEKVFHHGVQNAFWASSPAIFRAKFAIQIVYIKHHHEIISL